MSLAINATTAEGLVLAADSRQSYRNKKGQARIGSDNVFKLFQLGKRTGVAAAGRAFLPEEGIPKNISKFIDEFKKENDLDKMSVKEVAQKLHEFFDKKYRPVYKKELKTLPEKIKKNLQRQGAELLDFEEKEGVIKFRFKDSQGQVRPGVGGVDRIDFLVAGYNKGGSHQVFTCYIPGKVSLKRDSRVKGKEYGASWIGQIDVVARVVLGRDPRTVDFLLQKGLIKPGVTPEALSKELGGLQYAINWGTMTLQDAIDFCSLIIETTSAIQRFSDGIAMNPGDVPGVGGPIDIAVITPDKGFVWITRKKLKVGEIEINLDKISSLEEETPRVKPKSRLRKK